MSEPCCTVPLSVEESPRLSLRISGANYNEPYTLPTMEEDVKGGAKLGAGLVVDGNERLSVNADGSTITIDENGVVSSVVVDGSVTTDKLADYAVTTNKIDDESITTDKLNDGVITTPKIADGAVTVEKLDSSVIKINESSEISGSNQRIFINHDALTSAEVAATNAKVAQVKETGMESFVTNAIFGSVNVNGERDCCAAVTIANSYLRYADQFVYDNSYTATTYEGTYSAPIASNPHNHKIDGKLPIDCATLTTLIGNGCLEEMSRYTSSGYVSKYFHAMYPETSESIKPYWLYNPRNETLPSVGYGRLLTDAQAKMFYDAGKLQLNTQTEGLQIGDIVYSGNASERFLGITHCSMVAGMVDATMAGVIIVEATTGTTNPIVSRTLADSGIASSLRAVVSPNYTSGIRLNATYGNYLIIDNGKNLNTSALTITAPGNSAGGNPATVIAITPNTSSNYNLTISLTNGISTIDKSITCNGVKLFIWPRGWSGSISSTTTSTTWNIATQRCCTDKMIYICPRT